MLTRLVLLFAILLTVHIAPASAQALFANPFAAVSQEARAPALMRYRYESRRQDAQQAAQTSEVVIEAGPDWSLVREGDRATLRDFRVSRTFEINADGSFVSFNAVAMPAFLVAEVQNRFALSQFVQGAGLVAPTPCDFESELGISPPQRMASAAFAFRTSRGAVQFTCDGQAHGGFTAGSGDAPPASFWPTLQMEMATHPALFHRMRDTAAAPHRIENTFEFAPDAVTSRSWRLVSAEQSDASYPLNASSINATAAHLSASTTGAGELAIDVVTGRANGGPPTIVSWNAQLADVARRDGRAAAAMLTVQAFNMFPELATACQTGQPLLVCTLVNELPTLARSDAALAALLAIVMAEQQGNPQAAIDAMVSARASPNANNPALGASFALALLQFDQAMTQRAQAAGVSTDISALQWAGVRELPYNPAYWSDLGDTHAANFDYLTAYLLYDIAFSLPMPGVEQGMALVSKQRYAQQIRGALPDFFLPH